jgi:VanZ family protein
MLQKFLRATAWFILIAIGFLTVVPPTLRPTTPVPHEIEHAAAFFSNGIMFGLAYPRRESVLSVGAVAFCAAIEISQLFVSGRHARLSDFILDTIAAFAGVFASSMLIRNHILFH